jgi:cytidine deaminase
VDDLRAELIEGAQAVLRPHRVGDRLLGTVGAALVTDAGHQYLMRLVDPGNLDTTVLLP